MIFILPETVIQDYMMYKLYTIIQITDRQLMQMVSWRRENAMHHKWFNDIFITEACTKRILKTDKVLIPAEVRTHYRLLKTCTNVGFHDNQKCVHTVLITVRGHALCIYRRSIHMHVFDYPKNSNLCRMDNPWGLIDRLWSSHRKTWPKHIKLIYVST